jgi:beta-phosphoglucomutase-like phosphatase (HAD superfamily)
MKDLPWLSPVPIRKAMLGLSPSIELCLFDLDGVLTDSDHLHADAWGTVLDDLLLRLSEQTGWQFVPFDRDTDYRTYIDGRSRLDGIHAFLESRGIHLPEGGEKDRPDARTVWGLANRKGNTVARALQSRGVRALGAARRYLQAAGRAGLCRGVMSASAYTLPMLELAGLAPLSDLWIDAAPPSPDALLDACRRAGSAPERTVAFTHRPAGVTAGRSAGMRVIGIGEGHDADLLRWLRADDVVPSLAVLLDRVLLA